jgi:hypothetical protein
MGMGTSWIPTTDKYPRKLINSGVQPTIYPRQLKYSGFQPTTYPTTDFLKHLILSYSFEIRLNTCRNNRNFISIYFKAGCHIVGWTPEFFSCLGYIVGWKPEYFGCLGYIVNCGYPIHTHTHTRGNSVAHV